MRRILLLTISMVLLVVSNTFSQDTLFYENFDAGVQPTGWTNQDINGVGADWVFGILDQNTTTFNGTNLANADSDTYGNGIHMRTSLTTPVFNTSGYTNIYVTFMQTYNDLVGGGQDSAILEIFDGTQWVEIQNLQSDEGMTGTSITPTPFILDVTAYSNANMQLRFTYDDGNNWAWYWAIDDVLVTGTPSVCTVNIPDANFKSYLVGNTAINTNGDTEIQCSEASVFTGQIDCSNWNITNLTGIEAFTALTYLYCQQNQLTALDVSQNTALEVLHCFSNQLTALDVSQNTALEVLRCDNNQLTALDVSQNTALVDLQCLNNQLTALDVLQNTALEVLRCHYNQLTALDVSQNTVLVNFYCYNNQLTSLNMANGNNINLTHFNATSNPNLTCIEVDDAAWSTTNLTAIDATASFSENCGVCIVNIPDTNFKSYLVGNTAINTNGDTEIQCSEASVFTGQINCPFLNITDLTGIEAFTNVYYIVCSYNDLTTLDFTSNSALEVLYCQNNDLTSLNVANNSLLRILSCQENNLTSIDVSSNSALTNLDCQVNLLTTLDVSANSSLHGMNFRDNNLSVLNIANGNNANYSYFAADNNPNLNCIQVDDSTFSANNWTSIDPQSYFSESCQAPCIVNIPDANFKSYLVGNTAINTNGDTEIQCSEASAFTGTIWCHTLGITDATGIEAFINVNHIGFPYNSLTSIDLSQNIVVDSLQFQGNDLSNIDVSNLSELKSIEIGSNQIDSLDVSMCPLVVRVYCPFNNPMTYLNVANGNNINFDFTGWTNNPNLFCIEVDDTAYANANFGKDAWASYSTDCSASPIVLVSSITVQGQNGVDVIATAGGSLQMEAAVLPANATDGTYTWSVTNGTGSASIDANGLLTASADGVVTVTATANDASGVSGQKDITISNQGTAIKDVAFEGLAIYPNPTNDVLNIKVNEVLTSIQLYDITGKVVKTFDVASTQLNVADIQQGIYFLELRNEEKRSVVKLSIL